MYVDREGSPLGELKMTEHVHEWMISFSSNNPLDGVCRCQWCPAILDITQTERRLNATERLSAENALRLADALDNIALAWDGKDAGKGTKRLRAYADILEGKDE